MEHLLGDGEAEAGRQGNWSLAWGQVGRSLGEKTRVGNQFSQLIFELSRII